MKRCVLPANSKPFRLTMAVPSEHDNQTSIRDALARHPAVSAVYRVNSGAHVVEEGNGRARRFVRYHDVEGMSDLWLWLKPRYGARQAFIEVKRRGAKPTAKQAAFLEMARQHGHIAFFVDDAADAWRLLSEAVKVSVPMDETNRF